MKFSVIIPVHNAEATLERSVQSVARQENCEKEIILIENASDDNSYQECLRLQAEYPSIVLQRTDRKGISHARNLGLQQAKGDIICFCDSDDYYQDHVLEQIEKLFVSTGADLITTGFMYGDDKNEQYKKMPEDRYMSAGEMIGRVFNDGRVFGSVWNKFYKKEIINHCRFCEDLSLCEDTHFNIQVLTNTPDAKCFCTQLCTYYYSYNESSAAHSNDYWNWQKSFDGDKLKYIIANYRVLNDCKLPRRIRREIGYSTVGHAIYYLHTYGHEIEREKKRALLREIRSNLFSFIIIMNKYHRRFNLTRLGWIIKELV